MAKQGDDWIEGFEPKAGKRSAKPKAAKVAESASGSALVRPDAALSASISASDIKVLEEGLSAPDPLTRQWAARHLAQTAPDEPSTIQALARALNDLSPQVRFEAVWAMGRLGPKALQAVSALGKSLRTDPHVAVRESIAKALVNIDRRGSVCLAMLVPGLRDPYPAVRFACAGGLRKLGSLAFDTTPALITALRDPDWMVRSASAAALGRIVPPSVPAKALNTIRLALTKTLKDPVTGVRESAREALAQLPETGSDSPS